MGAKLKKETWKPPSAPTVKDPGAEVWAPEEGNNQATLAGDLVLCLSMRSLHTAVQGHGNSNGVLTERETEDGGRIKEPGGTSVPEQRCAMGKGGHRNCTFACLWIQEGAVSCTGKRKKSQEVLGFKRGREEGTRHHSAGHWNVHHLTDVADNSVGWALHAHLTDGHGEQWGAPGIGPRACTCTCSPSFPLQCL